MKAAVKAEVEGVVRAALTMVLDVKMTDREVRQLILDEAAKIAEEEPNRGDTLPDFFRVNGVKQRTGRCGGPAIFRRALNLSKPLVRLMLSCSLTPRRN